MMTDLSLVKELMSSFEESRCSELELECEGMKLKLKKETSPADEVIGKVPTKEIEGSSKKPEYSEDKTPGESVLSPLVGVVYASPGPDDAPFVREGDHVNKGQTLCQIEAMKMINEVKAPRDGTVKKIFFKDRDVVEFESPLFVIGD